MTIAQAIDVLTTACPSGWALHWQRLQSCGAHQLEVDADAGGGYRVTSLLPIESGAVYDGHVRHVINHIRREDAFRQRAAHTQAA